MKADIYKTRTPDAYLFVRAGTDQRRMPETMLAPLQPIEFFRTIELEGAKVSDPVAIEADITKHGFSVRQEKAIMVINERKAQ